MRSGQRLRRRTGPGPETRPGCAASALPQKGQRALGDQLATRLRAVGVTDPHIDRETCATIERPVSGKLRLVIADPAGPALA